MSKRKQDPAQGKRNDRVEIHRLPTGVPGLDEILGGGLPEYQITPKGLVIGAPLRGCRALTSGIPSPWSLDSDGAREPRTDAEGDNPHE
jgi:hypothetical protein